MENGYYDYNRFPALEVAWPGIVPALPLFLIGENARLQTVCDALQSFFEFQGRWDERLALCKKAETKAVATTDHNSAGWRAYQAGYIHVLRQQAVDVLNCAARAAEHWERAKAGARERATAIRLRGIGHQLDADYPAAVAALHKALELLRSLSAESDLVAVVLNDLAGAEFSLGDRAAAEGHSLEALRVAQAVGDVEGVANYTGNLAELALDREDWPTAETWAREALRLSEAIHRQQLIALDNQRLAHALTRQGKTAHALPYARRAVEIFTHLDSPDLARAQIILAECEGGKAVG
jgi:tetratricopeptide (TPR) repeat protein